MSAQTTMMEWTQQRARALSEETEARNHARTDQMFAVLMGLQFVAGLLAALVLSPHTWEGSARSIHPHVHLALWLGGAINGGPALLALLQPGKALTRHVIAVGQALASALLIHLSGGRLETHFHIFGQPVELLVLSKQTGGAFSLGRQTCAPGEGTPPHMHLHEDEVFSTVSISE